MSTPDEGPVRGSFRDPAGFVFRRQGQLYRQINQVHAAHYESFMASGLYRLLVERGLLVSHDEVTIPPARPAGAYKVIRPTPVPFVSYPYEWCFSQLKEAALATLQVQRLALEHGFTLRDASAYNVQFIGFRPVLIDTLSFARAEELRPWVAYRQFCQHFLAPLALMAYVDPRLGQLLRVHVDGVPLDLASRLLPWRSRLRAGLALHIHLHAQAQLRYAGRAPRPRGMSRAAQLGLVDSLAAAVAGLRPRWRVTTWEEYEATTSYSPGAAASKRQIVSAWLARVRPGRVWDLGANVGEFSRMAVGVGAVVVAMDADHGAVEKNYRQAAADREERLLPLWVDLTNPSPGVGWGNAERDSLLARGPADMVLALALVHHLAIANNVPLPMVAELLASLGRWAVVEFVPKSDPQVQRMLAAREDIFSEYDLAGFERAFGRFFFLRERQQVRESSRVLYLFERREGRPGTVQAEAELVQEDGR